MLYAQSMNNIWFTSDTHFNHSKIMEYCTRRQEIAKTVLEMNEYLITQWNNCVQPNDIVYHLGDFGFGSVEELIKIVKRLHGHKYLIPGNHDQRFMNNPKFVQMWKSVLPAYTEMTIKNPNLFLVLCHYPFSSWNKMHYQSIHLHGHIHTDYLSGDGPMSNFKFDVGVDHHYNFSPFRLINIIKSCQP